MRLVYDRDSYTLAKIHCRLRISFHWFWNSSTVSGRTKLPVAANLISKIFKERKLWNKAKRQRYLIFHEWVNLWPLANPIQKLKCITICCNCFIVMMRSSISIFLRSPLHSVDGLGRKSIFVRSSYCTVSPIGLLGALPFLTPLLAYNPLRARILDSEISKDQCLQS